MNDAKHFSLILMSIIIMNKKCDAAQLPYKKMKMRMSVNKKKRYNNESAIQNA